MTHARLIGWLVAAALAAVLVARSFAGGGGEPQGPPIALDAPASRPDGWEPGVGGGTGPARGGLYVHVAGAVRRPGLYRVAAGSRVAAALDLAGGPTRRAELTGVNLAAPLADGQQVVVPGRGRAVTPAGPASASPHPGSDGRGSGGAGSGGAPISLATATVEQLDALDGIGPTLARRIVEYRDRNGGIRSVDELRQIEGIGEKRFAALREAVAP